MLINLIKTAIPLFLMLLSYCISLDVNAQSRPTHMRFSYIAHPVIINELTPIVEQAYKELGIELTLELYPSKRNLIAIDNETLDGDIAYSYLALQEYDSIIKLDPPLVNSVFILLCQTNIPCNQQVLFSDENLIVSTDTIRVSAARYYSRPITDSFYIINNLAVIPDLLTQGRFKYALYVLGESQSQDDLFENLSVAELFKSYGNHSIHKKYAFMQDEISAALQRALDAAKGQKKH